MLNGFDIYSGTGPVDFSKRGGQFVAVKVSQGTTYESRGQDGGIPWWEATDAALGSGFVGVLLYHFIRVDLGGRQNAEWFGECLGRRGGIRVGCGYALDVEDDPDAPYAPNADLRAGVLEYLHTLSPPQSPFPPVFRYWGAAYGRLHNLRPGADFAPHPYWWPSWAGVGPIPPSGETLTLEQTGTGTVAGVANPVDLDTFHGSAFDLSRYLWGYQESPIDRPFPPDVDPSSDLPTILRASSLNVKRANADLDLARTKFPWPV